MILSIKNLCAGYMGRQVLNNVSVSVKSGEILCLLGPNGVGKTTLFKSILGFVRVSSGEITIDDKKLSKLPKKEFARSIGYVPQQHEPPFPCKVLDVVVLGRMPYMSPLSVPKKEDVKIARQALDSIGILHLENKDYTEISGGERQMVLIARAIAQNPRFLIMDEPTANLDYGNQVKILEQVKRLSQKGMGVVMTTHSPEHAFLCSTRVALLYRDDIMELGSAEEIICPEKMKKAYGIDVRVLEARDEEGNIIKGCVPRLNN